VTLVFASGEHHAAARRWLTRLMPRPITYTDAVSFAVMESVECRYFLGFDDDFRAAGFLRLEQS
jgi:predicted nucleic acid-binding protein